MTKPALNNWMHC